jgi:hypothetical protein
MPYISCPCGFRAETDDDFDFDKANAAYDAHGCQHHPAVKPKTGNEWAGTVSAVAFLAAVVLVCYIIAAVN